LAWTANAKPNATPQDRLIGRLGDALYASNITEQNRRIFVPTPHGSPSWQRGYARRSALERINNRIDNSFCLKNTLSGVRPNENPYGASAGGYDGHALGHVKAGSIEQMRSLVQPIRQTVKLILRRFPTQADAPARGAIA